MEGNEEATVNF